MNHLFTFQLTALILGTALCTTNAQATPTTENSSGRIEENSMPVNMVPTAEAVHKPEMKVEESRSSDNAVSPESDTQRHAGDDVIDSLAEKGITAPSLKERIDSLVKRIDVLEKNTKSEGNTRREGLSEESKDAYSVGLMVAQYASRIMKEMNDIGVELDAEDVRQGVSDGLSNTSLLESSLALTRITALEKKMQAAVSAKQTEAQEILREVAKTNNTLKQDSQSVWVNKKTRAAGGRPAVSVEQTVRHYRGELIAEPSQRNIKGQKLSNDLLKTAIELAKGDGIIELYALPSAIRNHITLPAEVLPWDIIQVTFDVRSK